MSGEILHITGRSDWEEALELGEYRADSLDSEGFIHCSNASQILRVAESFYAGQAGLVLLVIDTGRLSAELRWEPAADGPPGGVMTGSLFPHIYGPIDLQAVTGVHEFAPGPDGRFRLPAALIP